MTASSNLTVSGSRPRISKDLLPTDKYVGEKLLKERARLLRQYDEDDIAALCGYFTDTVGSGCHCLLASDCLKSLKVLLSEWLHAKFLYETVIIDRFDIARVIDLPCDIVWVDLLPRALLLFDLRFD